MVGTVGSTGGLNYHLPASHQTDSFITLECFGLFIQGVLLTKHRFALIQTYQRLPRWPQGTLFAGGVIGYAAGWWVVWRKRAAVLLFFRQRTDGPWCCRSDDGFRALAMFLSAAV